MKNSLLDNPSSAEARGKRIRFIRDHLLSLTRNEFCQDSDITSAAMKGWELGWGGGLTAQGAEKIAKRARVLNVYCSDAWLMHGLGREATYLSQELNIQESEETHIAKELLLFSELPNSINAMVKDDGMMPLLFPGNHVAGIICNKIENALGKECILIDEENNTYVRILKPGLSQNLYNLLCLNQNPNLVKKEIKNIAIRLAAPIVWIRRIFIEDQG
ncbi:MAG: hypothetical protein H0U75_00665 [Legionella sp.]|nr:hypothetical protein [Legionella sp.]